jgi:ABC-2 type transport system permease protein
MHEAAIRGVDDMTATITPIPNPGFSLSQYLICLKGVLKREGLRFLNQRERFVSSLVRPLLWLFIFAAGFRQVLGVSIIPPYKTYVLYEVYITPGLCGMILLFSGMQSSLSMVYDREMGNMRTLLVSPFPRWFLLVAKLLAGVTVAIAQVYAFLFIAWFWGVKAPPVGYIAVLPALFLGGLMLGALGLLLSSLIKKLENFAGIMNFVIFPMYFASAALYPLWRVQESSPLLFPHLPGEPIHLCRRADPLRLLRPDRMDIAGGRRGLHGDFPWRRHHRLRSFAGADGAQAGWRRKRMMTRQKELFSSPGQKGWGRRLLLGILVAYALPAHARPRRRPGLALHPAQGAGAFPSSNLERA